MTRSPRGNSHCSVPERLSLRALGRRPVDSRRRRVCIVQPHRLEAWRNVSRTSGTNSPSAVIIGGREVNEAVIARPFMRRIGQAALSAAYAVRCMGGPCGSDHRWCPFAVVVVRAGAIGARARSLTVRVRGCGEGSHRGVSCGRGLVGLVIGGAGGSPFGRGGSGHGGVSGSLFGRFGGGHRWCPFAVVVVRAGAIGVVAGSLTGQGRGRGEGSHRGVSCGRDLAGLAIGGAGGSAFGRVGPGVCGHGGFLSVTDRGSAIGVGRRSPVGLLNSAEYRRSKPVTGHVCDLPGTPIDDCLTHTARQE